MAKLVKKILKSNFVGYCASWVFANSLRLTYYTSRKVYEPADMRSNRDMSRPVIFVSWHGHSYIGSYMYKREDRPTLLVARHGDGRLVGNALAILGGGNLVFGSGSNDKTGLKRRGGAVAFLQLLKILRGGDSVTTSADVPKIARVVGEGVILLARKSGAPLVPIAMASSRRHYLSSWDKMVINLPFSRLAYVQGEPLFVPNDDSPLATHQALLEDKINAANDRALALADGAEPNK